MRKEITGNKYGMLKVLGFSHQNKARFLYTCLCDCGNKKDVDYYNLTNGRSRSCGCLRSKINSARLETHKMTKTRFYTIYVNMKQRCENKNNTSYFRYGGRGIKCDWDCLDDFKKDMYDWYLVHVKKYGEKNTTLDRIDNNGNYNKENCRWATMKEQQSNRRNTEFIVYEGNTVCMSDYINEVENKHNLSVSALRKRIKNRVPLSLPHGAVYNRKRKHDMLGFNSWAEFSSRVGITRQRIFQLIKKGLSTKDILQRYEKNTPNQELSRAGNGQT